MSTTCVTAALTDYCLLVPAVGGAGRGSGPPGEGADTQPPHRQRAGE